MMNVLRKTIATVALSVAASGAAIAANSDLLVSAISVGNGSQLSFEFVNDAGATSLQFDVNVTGVKFETIDNANCVSGLPKTFSGACSLKDGKLRVLVYSLNNDVIPSGSLGSIMVGAPQGELAKHASVTGLTLAAPDGVRPSGEAFMDFGAGNKPGGRESNR